MPIVNIAEGTTPAATRAGTTYRISFLPPRGMTAEMIAPAWSGASNALRPNIVRSVTLTDAGDVEALVEIVVGGHIGTTSFLRRQVIDAVTTVAGGGTVPSWALAPLDSRGQAPVAVGGDRTVLYVIAGIAAIGAIALMAARISQQESTSRGAR